MHNRICHGICNYLPGLERGGVDTKVEEGASVDDEVESSLVGRGVVSSSLSSAMLVVPVK